MPKKGKKSGKLSKMTEEERLAYEEQKRLQEEEMKKKKRNRMSAKQRQIHKVSVDT